MTKFHSTYVQNFSVEAQEMTNVIRKQMPRLINTFQAPVPCGVTPQLITL